jgi:LuxR family transcriptional regulator, maltose regulon positive regulatory protein
MVKRPEPVSAEIGERAALLATKLRLPQRQPGFVSRQRLLDRLDEALARGLTLVCAPAGFGKTTLLADWIRRGRRPTAWLSLDAADSDPARFWQHAVAALDRARPGIAEGVTPLLGPPAPPSFDGLVTALINEMAAAPADGELLLVLDDYQLIDSAAVHASLTFLLEHLPRGLHVVLATRADPQLALARLRVRGQLAELRTAELRFTTEEAGSLFREAGLADLPGVAAAALAARTEGWGAGLRLAALSLRGQPDVTKFVATFSGSHRYVLDYLTEDVLEHQTEPVREFLLDTSVLERLSGDLCDAVTGRTNSQAMLETIEAAGLFLVPLDDVRGWWRYHHLFADLLRIRLQQERPGRTAQLHRNAATWHEEHDLTDEAVRHAMAAEETSWAARLTEQHFDELFYLRGERATVQRWLSALPGELIRSRPRLLVAATAMADSTGDVDAVDGLLDAAERASADAADEPFEPSAGRAASLLVNVPATIAIFRAYRAEVRGDAAGTAAAVSRALAKIDEGESMLAFITHGHQAVAEWLSGRLEAAERELSSSIGEWRAAGHRNLIGWGSHHLGQIQDALGRLEAAEHTYRQTLESTVMTGRAALPAAGVGYAGLAAVAYQRDELDEASRLVSEGIALCRQFSFTPPLATALATLAWIRQAQGDPVGALEAMSDAVRAAPGRAVADLLNPVPAQRARLLLAQGDAAAAERWTRERAVRPDDEPSYPSEMAYLVLARILLAQGKPEQALPLLRRIHTAADAQRRIGSVIQVRALQALALAACGDNAAAADVLAEALALGRPERHIRVFVDEGAPMQTLLERVVREPGAEPPGRAISAEYIARLLRAFGPDVAPGRGGAAAAAVPGLVEQLTPREIEVLGLLAAGKSNSRIAEELVVTLDTVKKHVSHILNKLDADNRTAAVTRGRTLGLIA